MKRVLRRTLELRVKGRTPYWNTSGNEERADRKLKQKGSGKVEEIEDGPSADPYEAEMVLAETEVRRSFSMSVK
jgi:hypothetical protein